VIAGCTRRLATPLALTWDLFAIRRASIDAGANPTVRISLAAGAEHMRLVLRLSSPEFDVAQALARGVLGSCLRNATFETRQIRIHVLRMGVRSDLA